MAVGLSALPASEENSPFVLVSTMRAVTEYMQQVHTESASEELRQPLRLSFGLLSSPRALALDPCLQTPYLGELPRSTLRARQMLREIRVSRGVT